MTMIQRRNSSTSLFVGGKWGEFLVTAYWLPPPTTGPLYAQQRGSFLLTLTYLTNLFSLVKELEIPPSHWLDLKFCTLHWFFSHLSDSNTDLIISKLLPISALYSNHRLVHIENLYTLKWNAFILHQHVKMYTQRRNRLFKFIDWHSTAHTMSKLLQFSML